MNKVYPCKNATIERNLKLMEKISNGYHIDGCNKDGYYKLIERADKFMSDPKAKPEIINIELSDIITEENGLSFEVLSEDTEDDKDNEKK